MRQEANAHARQALHPQHLGPFPSGLQGEENKEWEGRTALENSLRSLLSEGPFPSLSDLLYKITGFYRFSGSSENRKKALENGKSLFSGQERLESKVHYTLAESTSTGSQEIKAKGFKTIPF